MASNEPENSIRTPTGVNKTSDTNQSPLIKEPAAGNHGAFTRPSINLGKSKGVMESAITMRPINGNNSINSKIIQLEDLEEEMEDSVITDSKRRRTRLEDITVPSDPTHAESHKGNFDGPFHEPCITSSHSSLVNCKVSQLMKIDQREWDHDIITDLFIPSEAQLILGIPLSNQAVDDVWYWCKETAGFYSVKSAYRHIQETKGHWASDEGSNFWKKFWKIKVPPKVLHFAWRALTECLATRDQLRIKHVPVAAACVFCNDASETTYHLFIECPFSVSCWNRSAVSLSFQIAPVFSTGLLKTGLGMVETI
ncbi:hypothetical protein G4B88_018496 [Cannabis sativa]|uniref:Reverse transcriptase zinc-binding domain-containing protein n=1 Tax=Cannabis sativa TaxID=3483 RepID=A0A7J6HGB9_CANSA|nr:hypothetical protein G4B88_018496 [Cannabis sativa]